MKKGFTLVELLAVIVILSVIAIITVPIIGNVIEESKKKALEQSTYGLIEAANYYAIKYEGEHGFEFEDGKQISSDKLDYKGTIQGSGKLYIDKNGDISLCINTDKYYVIKNYNSGIEIKDKNEYGCSIEQDPLTNKYVAYLDNGENGPISVYTKSESDERYVLKSELASYTTKEYVDAQDNILSGRIGTLNNLNVSDENKNDLVSAINEVNNKITWNHEIAIVPSGTVFKTVIMPKDWEEAVVIVRVDAGTVNFSNQYHLFRESLHSTEGNEITGGIIGTNLMSSVIQYWPDTQSETTNSSGKILFRSANYNNTAVGTTNGSNLYMDVYWH